MVPKQTRIDKGFDGFLEVYTCPERYQPMDEVCYDCGVFFEKIKNALTINSDTVKRISRSYLKVFHFKEILSEIQGRENITIHPDLFETIKESVPPDIDLNVANMRSILKPLKLHMLKWNWILLIVSVACSKI